MHTPTSQLPLLYQVQHRVGISIQLVLLDTSNSPRFFVDIIVNETMLFSIETIVSLLALASGAFAATPQCNQGGAFFSLRRRPDCVQRRLAEPDQLPVRTDCDADRRFRVRAGLAHARGVVQDDGRLQRAVQHKSSRAAARAVASDRRVPSRSSRESRVVSRSSLLIERPCGQ